MQELLKNNDQLYSELRKTNERYLNQRVENTKLKDEIQMLQNQLEQSMRSPTESPLTTEKAARQQIKLKSRPNRHEGSVGAP